MQRAALYEQETFLQIFAFVVRKPLLLTLSLSSASVMAVIARMDLLQQCAEATALTVGSGNIEGVCAFPPGSRAEAAWSFLLAQARVLLHFQCIFCLGSRVITLFFAAVGTYQPTNHRAAH